MKTFAIQTESEHTGSGSTVSGIAAVFDAVLDAIGNDEQITIKEIKPIDADSNIGV